MGEVLVNELSAKISNVEVKCTEIYHKIKNIYERDINNKRIIEGKFTDETIEYLKDNM